MCECAIHFSDHLLLFLGAQGSFTIPLPIGIASFYSKFDFCGWRFDEIIGPTWWNRPYGPQWAAHSGDIADYLLLFRNCKRRRWQTLNTGISWKAGPWLCDFRAGTRRECGAIHLLVCDAMKSLRSIKIVCDERQLDKQKVKTKCVHLIAGSSN